MVEANQNYSCVETWKKVGVLIYSVVKLLEVDMTFDFDLLFSGLGYYTGRLGRTPLSSPKLTLRSGYDL